jgi:hypothetical protein
LIADVDAVYRDVDAAFKLRHVLAHEAASRLELERADVERLFTAVWLLIDGIDAVLWATVYADMPLTQTEMNIKAGETLGEARDAMKAVLARTSDLAERQDGDASWVAESQAKWQAYRTHWLESTYRKLQGTMWPAVGAHDEESMTKHRADELRHWNATQLGDQSEHPDHPNYKKIG